MHRLAILAACLTLAACAGTQTAAPRAATPAPRATPQPAPQTPPAAHATGFRAPRVMVVPGLEGVIGRTARSLEAAFGTAALRVREGDGAKLQWRGEACVLDVYLYPLTKGAEPTATYVATRRASDGQDVDRVTCVNALRRP